MRSTHCKRTVDNKILVCKHVASHVLFDDGCLLSLRVLTGAAKCNQGGNASMLTGTWCCSSIVQDGRLPRRWILHVRTREHPCMAVFKLGRDTCVFDVLANNIAYLRWIAKKCFTQLPLLDTMCNWRNTGFSVDPA